MADFWSILEIPIYIVQNFLFFVDDSDENEYLLRVPKKKLKLMPKAAPPTETDLEELSEAVKQKFDQRKATKQNGNSKSERKKAKQEKLLKKQKLVNLKQTMANELKKQDSSSKKIKVKNDPDKVQTNSNTVYNKEGKIFFSKIQIEGEKKRKVVDTNPQSNLQKLKAQKKKILELVGSGDKMKAKEEKVKVLWKAAFEKTDGLKIKDNAEILKKTIKKRKVEKKKSKSKWAERKQKVSEKQATLQKKREDNLNKRKTDKQKKNLKHAVKQGRFIKGVSG